MAQKLHAERRAFERYGVVCDLEKVKDDILHGRVSCHHTQSKRVMRVIMRVDGIEGEIPVVFDRYRQQVVTFLPRNEVENIRICAAVGWVNDNRPEVADEPVKVPQRSLQKEQLATLKYAIEKQRNARFIEFDADDNFVYEVLRKNKSYRVVLPPDRQSILNASVILPAAEPAN